MWVKLDEAVETRDGVRLSADVYLPPGDGPFPALAARTIQDNQASEAIEWVPWSGRNNLKVFGLLSAAIDSIEKGGGPVDVAGDGPYAEAYRTRGEWSVL